ncbi:Hypothetical predicted protein [Octopus vulgaris]|uniref:Uncharacterized protein n=1 Tax=Octopus vulgaris TaxID=6645 RepID=A0AA36AJI3_OCTVU|nr:Hypothetical predicted protein [Octopus vulgaris]
MLKILFQIHLSSVCIIAPHSADIIDMEKIAMNQKQSEELLQLRNSESATTSNDIRYSDPVYLVTEEKGKRIV